VKRGCRFDPNEILGKCLNVRVTLFLNEIFSREHMDTKASALVSQTLEGEGDTFSKPKQRNKHSPTSIHGSKQMTTTKPKISTTSAKQVRSNQHKRERIHPYS
jgi:hypothetical protein